MEYSGHKVFAMAMGILLILRGMLGFLVREQFLGLSATIDHGLTHLIFGTCLFWAGTWAKRKTARAWNKFIGWLYAVISLFGIADAVFLTRFLGANTLGDDVFNVMVAVTCLVAGYYGTKLHEDLKR